jgi:hypothetical protein
MHKPVKAFFPLEELAGQSNKMNLFMLQESAESKVCFKHILLTCADHVTLTSLTGGDRSIGIVR